MEKKRIFRIGKFLLFVVIIISGYFFLRFTRFSQYLDPEKLRSFIASWESMAPSVFIAISAIRPVFLFPASILSIVGGILFGSLLGTLYAVAGSTLGAVVAYSLSKILGSDFIHIIFGNQLLRIESILSEQGIRIIFVLRLIPVIPFDLVNYASGLVRVKFLDYVTGTALGLVPATFAYTFLGESLKRIYSFQFLLSIIFFILLIYIPIQYERRRKMAGKPSLIDIKKEKQDK